MGTRRKQERKILSMLRLLLLLTFLPYPTASTARAPEECIVGETWTENHISFECYTGKGTVVKGVRAVGCVPEEAKPVILPGSTYQTEHFTYKCSKTGESVTFDIINCRDAEGKVLAIGESRTMKDGSTRNCTKEHDGKAVEMVEKKVIGCEYDGILIPHGKIFHKNTQLKVLMNGVTKVVGKALRMECMKVGTAFIVKPVGCVTSANLNIDNNTFSMVDNIFIKCRVFKNGTALISLVDEKEVECAVDGKKLKHNETILRGQTDVFKCSFGVLKKSGCAVEGLILSLETVGKKGFLCRKDNGVMKIDNATGCIIPGNIVKKFKSAWANGTQFVRCQYNLTGTTIIPFIQIIGCSHNKKKVDMNKIIESGGTVIKCGTVDGIWQMRNLTLEENYEYIAKKGTLSTKIYKGSNGSGVGSAITAAPTPGIASIESTTSNSSALDTTINRSTTAATAAATSTTSRKTTATSSTVAATTKKPTAPSTPKRDVAVKCNQLWVVSFYYNYGHGVHAFCADVHCVNKIQRNGIGYDMVNGKGVVGKAVRESSIAAVRQSCPIGSAHLRNLGFTKTGQHYTHNLNGQGLKQGWVSIVRGACGANREIRRWKSRYSPDIMYSPNLESNTWYKGMVQNGGKVHFYMWN